MNKFLFVFMVFCSLLLSGCVVTQPAPATQVTAANSLPAKSYTTLLCTADVTDKYNKTTPLGNAYVDDYGPFFVVRNLKGKTVAVSPVMTEQSGNMYTGSRNNMVFSKGFGKWTGLYGTSGTINGQEFTLLYNCR